MKRAAPEPTRLWGSGPGDPFWDPTLFPPGHVKPSVHSATYRPGVSGSRKCTYPGGPLWVGGSQACAG